MRRRTLLIPLSLLVGGWGCAAPEESATTAQAAATPLKGYQEREETVSSDLPLRAVSLRVLQQDLATCMPQGNCQPDALSFGRLTRILGYSLDRDNSDVLIFGLADPKLPSLRTDDFVVALRNSWLQYAPLEGNTYRYTFPGCDIRPEPAQVQRLQEVGQQMFSSSNPEQTEAVIRSWDQTCELPQTVSVLGIPFDTHFGHVMVTADYDMKRLADGSDKVDVPGLTSMMDAEFRTAEDALRRGQPLAMKASMNRFWLTPGDLQFEEAEGIVWIHPCPVRIQTHPIGADTSGTLDDVAGGDPAAEDFAHRFTALYDQVAEKRPVYRELRSLFQIFTVTQSLRFRKAPEEVGLDLEYLLSSYPVSEMPVKHEVPGRHVVKRFRHERELPNGTEIIQFWMPSCGGVEMRVEPVVGNFQSSESDVLPYLRDRLRDSRPVFPTSAWNVAAKNESYSEEINDSLRNQGLNKPGGPLVVTVEDQGTEYRAVAGSPIYKGLNSETLINKLKGLAFQQGTESIVIQLQGFSDEKVRIFTEDCKLHLKQVLPNGEIRTLQDVSENTLELLVTPGIQLERGDRPAQPFGGLFRAFVSFWVQVGEKMYKVTLIIVGTSAAIVDSFLEKINAPFALYDSLPLSVIQLIDQTRRELGAYGLKIEFQDETGKSHYVDLARSPNEKDV